MGGIERTPGIRPRPTTWRRIDAAARGWFPAAFAAILLLILAAPLGLPAQAELQQAAALACVFFWSVFRPAAMTPPVVFMIGLLADLLGMAPIGTCALTFLIVHGVALRWRRHLARQGFGLVWLAFAAVSTGAAAFFWALSSALGLVLLPVAPAAFQAGVSAGLYPVLAVLLTRAHRGLADPERA